MTELQENTKELVIKMFEDLASQQTQVAYKSAVPLVHVPNELIAQWDGNNHKKNYKWYREIWSLYQWQVLSKFDNEFNSLVENLPKKVPDVPEIFENTNWKKIIELA